MWWMCWQQCYYQIEPEGSRIFRGDGRITIFASNCPFVRLGEDKVQGAKSEDKEGEAEEPHTNPPFSYSSSLESTDALHGILESLHRSSHLTLHFSIHVAFEGRF
jgi:hypothetical protein